MLENSRRYYYVDEAGDLTFFDKRGSLMLGQLGVSHTFMLGVLHLKDPQEAKRRLDELRQDLFANPEMMKIPSMQPDQRKTALMFHAKDDHPKVREKVFEILPTLGAKVQIAIRRKADLAAQFKKRFMKNKQKLQEGDVYDKLVTLVFKNILHQADENHIIFARLGTSERRKALATAIQKAQTEFEEKWHKGYKKTTRIDVKKSSDEIGLQIIDYYLWAVHRLVEKGDDRYFLPLQDDYSVIIDLDDKRDKRWSGTWYTRKNPLTLEKIKPLTS
jgi:hypothetical protein